MDSIGEAGRQLKDRGFDNTLLLVVVEIGMDLFLPQNSTPVCRFERFLMDGDAMTTY